MSCHPNGMGGKYAALTIDQLPLGISNCDISAIGVIGDTSAMPETKGRRPAITAISSVFICRFLSMVVSTITPCSRVCRRDSQRTKTQCSRRRLCVSIAHIIFLSGNDETEFSKKLNFCEPADSSEAFFSFSVLVAVLVNTATERDCPEQHPADTAGVCTDEHVKEQDD